MYTQAMQPLLLFLVLVSWSRAIASMPICVPGSGSVTTFGKQQCKFAHKLFPCGVCVSIQIVSCFLLIVCLLLFSLFTSIFGILPMSHTCQLRTTS